MFLMTPILISYLSPYVVQIYAVKCNVIISKNLLCCIKFHDKHCAAHEVLHVNFARALASLASSSLDRPAQAQHQFCIQHDHVRNVRCCGRNLTTQQVRSPSFSCQRAVRRHRSQLCQIARFLLKFSIGLSFTYVEQSAAFLWHHRTALLVDRRRATVRECMTTAGHPRGPHSLLSNSTAALKVVKLYRRRSIPGLFPYFGSDAQQTRCPNPRARSKSLWPFFMALKMSSCCIE